MHTRLGVVSHVFRYITNDFNLAEVKSLRVKQRVPFRGSRYDGLFEVPTLDEILSLLSAMNEHLETSVGIYIETKHPTYFESVRLAQLPTSLICSKDIPTTSLSSIVWPLTALF